MAHTQQSENWHAEHNLKKCKMNKSKIKIYYTSFDNQLDDGTFNIYLAKLPTAIQEKIIRYKRWQNRQECLLGNLLLIIGLLEFGFSENSLNDITYNNYGRPFINDSMDFNISHSGNYVVCAMAKGIKIGIDIEKLKCNNLADFEPAMTEYQWKQIYESQSPHTKFYNYWTIKESVIKADGKGMLVPLDKIFIEDNIAGYGTDKWHLYPISIDNEYSCTLASNVPDSLVEVKKMELFSNNRYYISQNLNSQL